MNVLLVENDRLARMVASRTLRQGGAHEVLAVARPSEAVEFGGGVDVILLAVKLDADDGRDVFRRLRAAGVTAPVLFVAGKGDRTDDLVALGAAGVLAKPLDGRAVAAALAKL